MLILAPVVVGAVTIAVTFRYGYRPGCLRFIGAFDVWVAHIPRSARAYGLMVHRVALGVDTARISSTGIDAAAPDALVRIVTVEVNVAHGLLVDRLATSSRVRDCLWRALAKHSSERRSVQDSALLIGVAHRIFGTRIAAQRIDAAQL